MSEQVIKTAEQLEEFILCKNGFYKWCQKYKTAMSADDLRTLADYLDRLNERWKAAVELNVSKEPNQ